MTSAPATRTLTAIETGRRAFKRALAWVDGSEFLAVVEKDMTARTGRPRAVSWKAVLTLLALCGWHGKGVLMLMDVWRIAEGLTTSQRAQLGITTVEYHHIESALADLSDATKPSVDPRTGEVVQDARLSLPVEDLCNMIVRATIPSCVPEPADLAIDSTDFETWGRRRSWGKDAKPDVAEGSLPQADYVPQKETTKSNESGWPRRARDGRLLHTRDEDSRDGFRSGKNLCRSGVFNGYDLHLATDVTPLGQERGLPPLVRSMHLASAGDSKAEAGLSTIDSARRLGSPVSKVLVDRGYTYLRAERWAMPLWQRGIEQVLDLHDNQHATRANVPMPGTVWVDGGLFIDTLPKSLRGLPAFTLGQTAEEKALLAARYDERAPFAFTAYGPRDAERGTQRYRGPALTGRVRCPNNPKSMRLNPSTRPTSPCKPGQPCACSKTVTLGPDDLIQLRQTRIYGTTKWKADYGRRSNVESGNAVLKTHHGGLRRGSTRVFGRAKNAILLAFIIGATNLRLIISRYDIDPGNTDLPTGPLLPKPSRTAKPSLHSRVFRRRIRREPAARATRPEAPTWANPKRMTDTH